MKKFLRTLTELTTEEKITLVGYTIAIAVITLALTAAVMAIKYPERITI